MRRVQAPPRVTLLLGMANTSISSYDEIAGMYHELWADWYLPAAMPALERLLFSRLPHGACVLDLCCGSGHVTKELVARGYQVTAVDNSAELIAIAQRNLPGVDFRVQDARDLQLEKRYDAVLSTFDSLNHILELDGLRRVFAGVQRSLKPGGLFLFDMNLEEAYSADLRQWAVDISDTSVGLVRGVFDPISKMARTELIWFVRTGQDNLWRQHRSVVKQQCYSQSEILLALTEAGFRGVEAVQSRDAGVVSELGFGRVFFLAGASVQRE
ncbi:MAG: class I SAM-dependent methyltransferase [Acidobacteriaceae bacterium]|nr:class I SAM-dependent methyltransferase [Acidobacteriaceae bacterium]